MLGARIVLRLSALTFLLGVGLASIDPSASSGFAGTSIASGNTASSRSSAFGIGYAAARSCSGVRVRAGASLQRVIASHAEGTTFCLAAGTYRVTSPVAVKGSDRLIGAGRDQTFIDGTALPERAEGILLASSGTHFANFDIFGAPTPEAGSGVFCSGSANCGKAFVLRGDSLNVRSVDCHDNGGNCIGGGGNATVTVTDLNCWHNGDAYSRTPSFRYAACIKRIATGTGPNRTTVTNSFIHDNPGAGVWCDHCKQGLFDIENNRIVDNGSDGIQWEMSGGWSSTDEALIKNNVLRRNNALDGESWRGGIGISSSNDIKVRHNRFGSNVVAGVNIIYVADRDPPQEDSRGVVVSDNTMNGDLVLGCDLTGVTCSGNS